MYCCIHLCTAGSCLLVADILRVIVRVRHRHVLGLVCYTVLAAFRYGEPESVVVIVRGSKSRLGNNLYVALLKTHHVVIFMSLSKSVFGIGRNFWRHPLSTYNFKTCRNGDDFQSHS